MLGHDWTRGSEETLVATQVREHDPGTGGDGSVGRVRIHPT